MFCASRLVFFDKWFVFMYITCEDLFYFFTTKNLLTLQYFQGYRKIRRRRTVGEMVSLTF